MNEEELKRERDVLKSKCSCFEKIGENQYISILDEYGEEIEQQMNNQIRAIYLLDRSIEEIERLNNIIDKKEQFLGDNIKRLEREVVKRDNIIKEAIEYIEKWQSFQHTNGSTHEELRNLKSILKGE